MRFTHHQAEDQVRQMVKNKVKLCQKISQQDKEEEAIEEVEDGDGGAKHTDIILTNWAGVA